MGNNTEAYWIAPDGMIYDVPRKHINFIAENTGLFNLTPEAYRACFNKHEEKYGFEGKARRELMTDAMEHGWIRCRLNNKAYTWHIELAVMFQSTAINLKKWVSEQIAQCKENKHVDFNYELHILNNQFCFSEDQMQVIEGKLSQLIEILIAYVIMKENMKLEKKSNNK